jgi:hypothetical protein
LLAALKQFGKELSDRWVGEGLAACLTFLRRSKMEYYILAGCAEAVWQGVIRQVELRRRIDCMFQAVMYGLKKQSLP